MFVEKICGLVGKILRKDYSSGWIDEKGKKVDIEELEEMDKCKIGGKYIIKKKISKKDIDITNGESVCFLTKNISIKCYIDGKKVYETKAKKTILDTASPGSNWNFYKFKEDDIDKNFEIHATRHFNDDSASIKLMRIANEREYILSYVYEHIFILAVYAMMFGLAFVLVVCGMILNDRKVGGICELLMSLGGTILTLTIWLTIDTRVLPIFFGTNSLFQTLSVSCLYLAPIPASYVLKNLFELEHTKVFKGIVWTCAFVNMGVWLLHMTGLLDIHDSLPMCHVYLIGVTSIIVGYILYEHRKKPKHTRGESLGNIAKIAAMVVLLLGIIVDIVRYKQGLLGVEASFIQVDILLVTVYCVSISISRIFDMNLELKQNEVISKLAYQDGLTGVHNRTAYIEKLEEIRNNAHEYEKIGIVAFDINNLKTVNDVYGHAEGDKLINTAAELIGQSFVENCNEYRIGGDEFIVIINSKDAERIYKMGAIQLKNSIQNYNNYYHKKYKVSVAIGVAFCDSDDIVNNLNKTLKEADSNMYIEKEKMKKDMQVVYNEGGLA